MEDRSKGKKPVTALLYRESAPFWPSVAPQGEPDVRPKATIPTNAPKHVVMVYRFGGIKRAYDFETLVRSFGVPASALSDAVNGWHVKTDSRCLEFAAKLMPFIYKIPKGRRNEEL